MKYWGVFFSFVVLVGCGRTVREERMEAAWHMKGNLLVALESGKQQLQVEMYGQKGSFWLIEGRDALFAGRIFWFHATSAGTNYIMNDVQKNYWMVVDQTWSEVFVDIFPVFFEPTLLSNGDAIINGYIMVEDGWVKSYQKGKWQLSVRKRSSNGMPRIVVIEGSNTKFFLDLDRIEKGYYHIPRYDNLPWQEVILAPGEGVWEVIYE